MQYHADGYNTSINNFFVTQISRKSSSLFQTNIKYLFDTKVPICEIIHIHPSHVISGYNISPNRVRLYILFYMKSFHDRIIFYSFTQTFTFESKNKLKNACKQR